MERTDSALPAGYSALNPSNPAVGGGSRPSQPQSGVAGDRRGSATPATDVPVPLPGRWQPPAGGFAKTKSSLGLHLEQDTPLSERGAAIPSGAFTPLGPSHTVVEGVEHLATAGHDRKSLCEAFSGLIQNRVEQAGLQVERVAVALFQAVEAAFTAVPKDSKQGGTQPVPLEMAARALFEALHSLPGVNMEDVLRPVLAAASSRNTGHALCAWLLAQRSGDGIRPDLWGTAMEQACGVADVAVKRAGWLQTTLDGIGLAQLRHMEEADGAPARQVAAAAFDVIALEVCKRVLQLTPQQIESLLARNTRDRERLVGSRDPQALKLHIVALLNAAMAPNEATPARVGAVVVALRNAFHAQGPAGRAAFTVAANAAIALAVNETYGEDGHAGTDIITKTNMRRALFGRFADGKLQPDAKSSVASSTTTGSSISSSVAGPNVPGKTD